VDTRQEEIYEAIHCLKPHSELQASLRAAALNILSELGQTRWLIYEQNVVGVPRPLLGVMVIWLCFLFFTFGLFAPSNGTVATCLVFAAISVSGAVLMTLDMYSPYRGLIQVSSEPVRVALEHLGR
jgi:hypothetical protein